MNQGEYELTQEFKSTFSDMFLLVNHIDVKINKKGDIHLQAILRLDE